jgi:hypothetical protein
VPKNAKILLKMTISKKYTKIQKQKRFILYYIKTMHIGKSCKYAEISREGFEYWRDNDDTFVRMFKDSKEYHNDEVISHIKKWTDDGDKEMLKFWASRKMRHRGFEDKPDLNILSVADKVQINFIPENKQMRYTEEDIEAEVQKRLEQK